MHDIFVEKPYQFTPPLTWYWPQHLLTQLGQFRGLARKEHGVVDFECRNLDRLRASMEAGYGIVLTPNHPRTADPISMYALCQQTPVALYSMASWHLFNQSRFTTFMLRLMGAFSVNREGLDRKAVDYAIDVLVEGKRPLLIFPSGVTSRINDRLMSFMDGPSLIARTAAKRRKKAGQPPVVVHPVAIKYLFQGDIDAACRPVLDAIEHRLSWKPAQRMPLIERLIRVGNALLTLKELEFHLVPDASMTLRQRQDRMINHLLEPLEQEWLGQTQSGSVTGRVKNLRMKIFPEISKNEVTVEERHRRWEQLEMSYLAQQIDCYPDRYLVELPSVDRILETVEKFEEDLFGKCRIHGQLKAILEVGPAIEVSDQRQRGVTSDPLMVQIREQLKSQLDRLQHESRLYPV